MPKQVDNAEELIDYAFSTLPISTSNPFIFTLLLMLIDVWISCHFNPTLCRSWSPTISFQAAFGSQGEDHSGTLLSEEKFKMNQ